MTNSRRLIVVGGIAAGLSAASRARRLDPTLRVDVYERTGYCAYSACGLPYVIGGVIPDHESLVMRTPAGGKFEGQIDGQGKAAGRLIVNCSYQFVWQRQPR